MLLAHGRNELVPAHPAHLHLHIVEIGQAAVRGSGGVSTCMYCACNELIAIAGMRAGAVGSKLVLLKQFVCGRPNVDIPSNVIAPALHAVSFHAR